jgi:hypothetical protein
MDTNVISDDLYCHHIEVWLVFHHRELFKIYCPSQELQVTDGTTDAKGIICSLAEL